MKPPPRHHRSGPSRRSPATPAVAAERSEVGHLEGDRICGSFNRSAIVTLFDRASRKVWLAAFDGPHDADATPAALQAFFGVRLTPQALSDDGSTLGFGGSWGGGALASAPPYCLLG